MPNLSTPFDDKPWPQERYYRDAPLWSASGVVSTVAATSTTTGPLALSFAVTGGVITVAMAIGRARVAGSLFERTVDPWTTGMAGAQPHEGSAPYALNTASQPRIDRLVLRRDLPAGATYPFILQGTPAANPVAAELGQSPVGIWDEPLFSWTLAGNSSTAVSNIVDERRWLDVASGRELPLPRKDGAAAFPGVTAGWTLGFSFVRKMGGGLGTLYLGFSRAAGAATVAVPTNGDIGNIIVANVPAEFRPAETTVLATGAAGRLCGGVLGADGNVTLTAVSADGGGIAAGESFSLGVAVYALATP